MPLDDPSSQGDLFGGGPPPFSAAAAEALARGAAGVPGFSHHKVRADDPTPHLRLHFDGGEMSAADGRAAVVTEAASLPGATVSQVPISPGAPGSASSKYPTWVVRLPGGRGVVKVVVGRKQTGGGRKGGAAYEEQVRADVDDLTGGGAARAVRLGNVKLSDVELTVRAPWAGPGNAFYIRFEAKMASGKFGEPAFGFKYTDDGRGGNFFPFAKGSLAGAGPGDPETQFHPTVYGDVRGEQLKTSLEGVAALLDGSPNVAWMAAIKEQFDAALLDGKVDDSDWEGNDPKKFTGVSRAAWNVINSRGKLPATKAVQLPASTIVEYYASKAAHYVQIEGKGLYAIDDVLDLGVPSLEASIGRVRCQARPFMNRSGEGPWYNVRVQMGADMNRLPASNFDADKIDDRIALEDRLKQVQRGEFVPSGPGVYVKMMKESRLRRGAVARSTGQGDRPMKMTTDKLRGLIREAIESHAFRHAPLTEASGCTKCDETGKALCPKCSKKHSPHGCDVCEGSGEVPCDECGGQATQVVPG